VTLNSLNIKELVGHTPAQPPHSIHSIGVKEGKFEVSLIVSTGHISTHFWQFEAIALVLTHDDASKFNPIFI